MLRYLRATWREQKHWYAAGFLASTVLFVLFLVVSWHEARFSVAQQKATGLAAIAESPLGFLWVREAAGGQPHRVKRDRVRLTQMPTVVAYAASERKIVKQAALVMSVPVPYDTATAVGAVAERLGGYVLSLVRSADSNRRQTAEVHLRVPAGRFGEAREEIRKLAGQVEQEKVESEDITGSYADRTSRLNSRRAVERQYLEVLKRAASVKDILEVHEKLGEIREEIETAEGELKRMAHEVAMSGISVRLNSEVAPVAPGVRWKAGDALKRAFNNSLAALVDYVETMAEVILLVPVILLWAVTLFFLGASAWRLLRWMWRFFVGKHANPVAPA